MKFLRAQAREFTKDTFVLDMEVGAKIVDSYISPVEPNNLIFIKEIDDNKEIDGYPRWFKCVQSEEIIHNDEMDEMMRIPTFICKIHNRTFEKNFDFYYLFEYVDLRGRRPQDLVLPSYISTDNDGKGFISLGCKRS